MPSLPHASRAPLVTVVLLALVLSSIGIAIVVLRNRTSSSDVARVDEFKREMDALSPHRRPGDEPKE